MGGSDLTLEGGLIDVGFYMQMLISVDEHLNDILFRIVQFDNLHANEYNDSAFPP